MQALHCRGSQESSEGHIGLLGGPVGPVGCLVVREGIYLGQMGADMGLMWGNGVLSTELCSEPHGQPHGLGGGSPGPIGGSLGPSGCPCGPR